MKALTICNPYPRHTWSLTKPVENRTWPTKHRGPLAIHAGKSRDWLNDKDEEEARLAGDPLIFGAIVVICLLADCVSVEDIYAGKYDNEYPQLILRQDCNGPWCWVLTDIKRLVTPVSWVGKQGLFNVPDEIMFMPMRPCTSSILRETLITEFAEQ